MRSAVNHLDGIGAPMIVFQGLETRVVPPNQAELMVEALKPAVAKMVIWGPHDRKLPRQPGQPLRGSLG